MDNAPSENARREIEKMGVTVAEPTTPAPSPREEPQQPLIEDRPEARRLGVISFSLACGVTFGTFSFLLGIMAGLFGWGVLIVEVLSSLYIGYEPSFVGSIAGGVWGFVDGCVGGALIAWLYNRFLIGRHR